MNRKRYIVISLFVAIALIYVFIHINLSEPKLIDKTIFLFLISFFYSLFYLFFNNDKIKISVEYLSFIALIMLFNNIYYGFLIIFLAYLISDLLKKIRWQMILRRMFIYSAIFLLLLPFYNKIQPQLLFITNIWSTFFLLSLVLLYILFIKIVINFIYIILEKRLLLKLFLQNLLSNFICFFIGTLFIIGYIYFWDKLSFNGIIVFNIFFILIVSIFQFLTKYSETKRKYKLLLSMMSKIIEKNTLQEQLEAIVSAILQYYPIYFISIWITNYEKKINELKIAQPADYLTQNIEYLPFGKGIIGKAVFEKKIIHIPNTLDDPDYYEGVKEVKSELTIPLIFKNKVLGVIDLESNEKYYFNSFIIDVFKELSFQLSFVLNNTLLYEKLSEQNKAIREMIARQKNIAKEVIQSYENLGQELYDINSKLTEFSKNNENLNKRIEEIKNNELKIDKKIHEIKNNMAKSNEMILSTFERLNSTNKTLENIFKISQDSKKDVENITQNIENINISLNKLQEISERTNILSFNAAIEAARAGAYGKGFAVVANNIKELANKSEMNINSTTNILNTFKKELENLENLYLNQQEIYKNAKKDVDNLRLNIENLINRAKKENINFQGELEDIKKTLGDISLLLSDVLKIAVEIESIKEKNNMIVERNSVVSKKIVNLEELINEILKTLGE